MNKNLQMISILIMIGTLAIAETPRNIPTLTIDQIEGNINTVTIHYTTTDPLGRELATTNWKYSIDGGATWILVDDEAISDNDPKLPGKHTLTWNTNIGQNNIAGEYQSNTLFLMEAYDLEIGPNGKWETAESLPTARSSLGAAIIDDQIVAIGGKDRDRRLTPSQFYSVANDTWNTERTIPISPRIDFALTTSENQIYLIGGYDNRRLGKTEVYNPGTQKWELVASMPTRRQSLAAAAVGGRVFALGGRSIYILDHNEVYDPIIDKWLTVTPMPTARQSFTAVSLKDRIYAIGGHNNAFLNVVEVYNPQSNTWKTIKPMPTPRSGLAGVVHDGRIYVTGGSHTGKALPMVEIYDSTTDTWEISAPMPTARYNHAAISFGGKIYVFGGLGDNGTLDSVEVFTVPRTSDVAISKQFTIANHMIGKILTLDEETEYRDTISIRGTAASSPTLQSWTLDYRSVDENSNGFIPISFSDQAVYNGDLGEWNTRDVPDGRYFVRLRVTDNNVVAVTDLLTIVIDNTPPPLSFHFSGAGLPNDFIRSNAAMMIDGQTEPRATVVSADIVHGNPPTRVPFAQLINIDPNGKISGNIRGLNFDDITSVMLELTIADPAGNETKTESNILKIDNTPPQIAITSPASQANFNGETVIIRGTMTDTFSGIQSVEIDAGFGWILVGSADQPDFHAKSGEWSYEYAPPTKDILLTFRARATDTAGNSAISDVRLVNFISELPTVDLISPIDNTQIVGSVEIVGSVDGVWRLEYAHGTDATEGWIEIANGETAIDAKTIAIWEIADLPDGNYTLKLTSKNDLAIAEVKRQNLFKSPRDPELSFRPNKPTNLEFPDLTEIRKSWDRGDGITLIASEFSDPNLADTHKNSQWQIRSDNGTYDLPILDSGENLENLISLTIQSVVEADRVYYWRVRYQDSSGEWSEWSDETFFTTRKIAQFTIKLRKGLNFISLPVKPLIPIRANDLAEKVGATLMMSFDNVKQNFVSFVPGITPKNNFDLRGGEGYIVNVLEDRDLLFEGTIWENAPSSPSPMIGSENWAFLFYVRSENLPKNALIELTNLARDQKFYRALSENGEIGIPFVDLRREAVIGFRDEIQIRLINQNYRTIAEPINFTINEKDLDLAFRVIDFSPRQLPDQSRLLQNYPNPFNPETWIPFELKNDGEIEIKIYDLNGDLIRAIPIGFRDAGRYTTRARSAYWDGKNEFGEIVSSGVYFCNLKTANATSIKKIVIVK